jgi:hypothetical protein
MKKYNELVKEGGVLSDYGKGFLKRLTDNLESALSSEEVRSMSVSQLRTFGGILAKLIGDAVSNRMEIKSNYENRFSIMSDNEFETYLKNKYGEKWTLTPLSKDEFARCEAMSDKPLKIFEMNEEELHKALINSGYYY